MMFQKKKKREKLPSPNWKNISSYRYRILIIDGSRSKNTKALLSSIQH